MCLLMLLSPKSKFLKDRDRDSLSLVESKNIRFRKKKKMEAMTERTSQAKVNIIGEPQVHQAYQNGRA